MRTLLLAAILATAAAASPDAQETWLDLPVGLEIRLAGTSVSIYGSGEKTSRQEMAIEERMIVLGKAEGGRLRVARLVLQTSPEGGYPDISILLLDPVAAQLLPEDPQAVMAVSMIMMPQPLAIPRIDRAHLDKDGSLEEVRRFSEFGMEMEAPHRLTVRRAADGKSVRLEIALAQPVKPETEGAPRFEKLTETYEIDLDGRRVLSFRKEMLLKAEEGALTAIWEVSEKGRQVLSAGALAQREAGARELMAAGDAKALEGFETRHPDLAPFAAAKRSAFEAQARFEEEERAREEAAQKMVGQPAPDFTLKDLAGKDVSLAGLRGKVVLLAFWGYG